MKIHEAKQRLMEFGREAGLTGGGLQEFVHTGLKPVRDELDNITAAIERVSNKLNGLDGRHIQIRASLSMDDLFAGLGP